jgi:hypothetical protein
VSIIATIEDGGGSRSLRFGDRSAETFAQRLVDDYRYRSALNAALRRRAAIRRPQAALGPAIDRRDVGVEPSSRIPEMAAGTPAGPARLLPQARPQGTAAPNQNQLQTRRNEGMDLGTILGGIRDVADTYYDIKYGDPRRRQQLPIMDDFGLGGTNIVSRRDAIRYASGNEVGPFGGGGNFPRRITPGGVIGGLAGGALGDLAQQGLNLLRGDEVFGGSMDNCNKPSDYVGHWDEMSGTYVLKKKRKRRRKQLITQSDIKGLAALKGVVGTGKIMETWIATHC